MFKTILLATDGSGQGAKAAEVAGNLAGRYDARLVIVTVLPRSLTLDEITARPQAGRFSKEVRDEMERVAHALDGVGSAENVAYLHVPAPSAAIEALGTEILAEAEGVAKAKGAKNLTTVTAIGSAAEEIVEAAGKAGADLIVMGSRGLTDLRGIIMGSVSHKVLHNADCPCLLTR
jgi:nucleotide-binding universal stress UspA family protein